MLPLTTGRRAALAVGVPLCLLLTANTGFNLVADIGRGEVPVSYSIPVSDGQVSVTTDGGDLTLRQATAGQANLAGTGYYSLVRPHITESSAAGVAAYRYRCAIPFGDCGLNATLSAPPGTAVSVSTGGGDVSADGAAGDLSLSTDGGNVRATAVTAAQVTARTGGGDVEIVFTRVPRNVRVSTSGGNVTIVVPPGGTQYHVVASTDGGNVTDTVQQDTASQNLITVTTGGGDITIRSAVNVSAGTLRFANGLAAGAGPGSVGHRPRKMRLVGHRPRTAPGQAGGKIVRLRS
jgi:hypothetical protein